jgi:hypothetical protein
MNSSPLALHAAFALLAALGTTQAATAFSKNSPSFLLFVNQGNASLSFVDPTTNRQIAEVHEDASEMVDHEVVR